MSSAGRVSLYERWEEGILVGDSPISVRILWASSAIWRTSKRCCGGSAAKDGEPAAIGTFPVNRPPRRPCAQRFVQGGECGVPPLWMAAPPTFSRCDQWEARTASRLSTCSPTVIDPSEETPGDGDGSIATWHGRATDGAIWERLQQERTIGRWRSHLPHTPQSKVSR